MTLHPIPTTSDAWHALRLKHIGASEVGILFGCAPAYAMGPWALWQVKAGYQPPPDVDSPREKWGLLLEDAIAGAAAEQEGWQVLPGQYASRDGLGATLDRIIAEPGPNDEGCVGPGVLELKSVDWLVHRRQWGEEPPLHILLQLQAQLAATGYTWGAVAALVGGHTLQIYRYAARPKVGAEILTRVADFWRSVAENKPPPIDGSDATTRMITDLAGPPEEEPLDLSADNEAPLLVAELLKIQAERKALEKEEAERKNRILAKMGPHVRGEGLGFKITVAVTPEKPDRPAVPGEVIKGRAESRRLMVREFAA